MLTFLEERRRRLAKARQEGYKEGYEEGYEEGYAAGLAEVREERRKRLKDEVEILSQDPRIAAILREDPKIRETLRKHGIEPPARENGGG